jgi:hypothetical protein
MNAEQRKLQRRVDNLKARLYPGAEQHAGNRREYGEEGQFVERRRYVTESASEPAPSGGGMVDLNGSPTTLRS